MGDKFKILSTIIMFILIAILIGILINYYNEPVELQGNSVTKNYVSTNLNPKNTSVISNHKSGDTLVNDNESGEEIVINTSSGDSNSGESQIEKIISKSNPIVPSNPTTPVIISSESTMTDKEKKEILTELDDTLMELLEVVDKVQTVDESRLITETEGEVQ